MIYLIDPTLPNRPPCVDKCLSKCPSLCHIKPLYGIDV